MKVKEILEILQVPAEELLTKLDNVGIVADLETEIAQDIIRKLSKVYKVDIKPSKLKKRPQRKSRREGTGTESGKETCNKRKERRSKREKRSRKETLEIEGGA